MKFFAKILVKLEKKIKNMPPVSKTSLVENYFDLQWFLLWISACSDLNETSGELNKTAEEDEETEIEPEVKIVKNLAALEEKKPVTPDPELFLANISIETLEETNGEKPAKLDERIRQVVKKEPTLKLDKIDSSEVIIIDEEEAEEIAARNFVYQGSLCK